MLTRWNELERSLEALDRLRRAMDATLGSERLSRTFAADAWPRMALDDAGDSLVLLAELPGLSEQDVELTANRDMVGLRGKRTVAAPNGYRSHRRERETYEFARNVSLPTPIDPEKVTASMRNGVLTIRMEKAPEARPRQISIKAS